MAINGKTYTHKRTYSSNKEEWKEGDTVKAKYNPDNPKRMFAEEEIYSHKEKVLGLIFGIAIVAILIILSGIFLFC